MELTIGLAIVAYLLGAIPSAVLVGKSYFGVDVREHGSLNAGATNTFRVLGTKAGSFVLVLDIIKGMTAANLMHFIPDDQIGDQLMAWEIGFGVLAVIGHIFPVFAGFRGGKGIATLLGLVFAINPVIAVGCILVFLLTLLLTNMVSAGSILATLAFSVLTYVLYGISEPVLQFFGIFAVLLVMYTHRANIGRIWRGEEKKIYLFRSKKGQSH